MIAAALLALEALVRCHVLSWAHTRGVLRLLVAAHVEAACASHSGPGIGRRIGNAVDDLIAPLTEWPNWHAALATLVRTTAQIWERPCPEMVGPLLRLAVRLDEGLPAATAEMATTTGDDATPCPHCSADIADGPPCKRCGWEPAGAPWGDGPEPDVALFADGRLHVKGAPTVELRPGVVVSALESLAYCSSCLRDRDDVAAANCLRPRWHERRSMLAASSPPVGLAGDAPLTAATSVPPIWQDAAPVEGSVALAEAGES